MRSAKLQGQRPTSGPVEWSLESRDPVRFEVLASHLAALVSVLVRDLYVGFLAALLTEDLD